jgi:hypothetical protein
MTFKCDSSHLLNWQNICRVNYLNRSEVDTELILFSAIEALPNMNIIFRSLIILNFRLPRLFFFCLGRTDHARTIFPRIIDSYAFLIFV